MCIRHYVLFATDGFIKLPLTSELCPPDNEDTRKKVYCFGFVGGLYSVDDNIIDKKLNYKDPDNYSYYKDNLLGQATIPSPPIWGEVGDSIYVTLINLGMKELPKFTDFHTVHMHGAHVSTQIDGFPEDSFGVPVWENFTEPPPNATYLFRPEHSGTYMYHCHVEASEHVQMGMYGALVIYPSMDSLKAAGISRDRYGKWYYKGSFLPNIPKSATNRNFTYENVLTYFDKEYIMLLSDIDTKWHESVNGGGNPPFSPVDFKPDFWLVNGRAFPDTLYPQTPEENSPKDAKQINYESYVHVKTGEKFLLRMINMGYQAVPWHIHGWHFMITGKDAMVNPFLVLDTMTNLWKHPHHLMETGFTVLIGSGETYDLIIETDDKRPLYYDYITKGTPGFKSLCSQLGKIGEKYPDAIFGIPTEPVNCPTPELINYLEICNSKEDKYFPQFYPMHNHDDYKVTNQGAYPGGQLTYMQVDAPECEN